MTAGILLRKVRALAADEPTAFAWVYPRRLAGSGYPASRGQVVWLSRQGIGSILTLTEDPLPDSWVHGSVAYTHIPMRDHEPPDQKSLDAAVGRIEEELSAGRAVLVHCQAGRGRTMCAIGAYVMKNKGLGAEETLSFLRGLRPGAVERGQEASLKEFEARLKPGGSGSHP